MTVRLKSSENGLNSPEIRQVSATSIKSKSWEVKKTSLAVELVLDRVSVIESDWDGRPSREVRCHRVYPLVGRFKGAPGGERDKNTVLGKSVSQLICNTSHFISGPNSSGF